MPTLPSPRDVALPRRTAVGGFVAATAAAVAGCTPRGIDRRPRPRSSASPTPDEDPDVTLAATVLSDEQRVLAVVVATLQQHPQLSAVLAGVRTAHQEHVDLLTEAVPHADRSPKASPSGPTPSGPTPSGPTPSGPTPSGPTPSASTGVPRRVGAALLALARAEDRLSLIGRRSAFAAQSGAFARVLAGMAAAAAQQSVTLAAAARERR